MHVHATNTDSRRRRGRLGERLLARPLTVFVAAIALTGATAQAASAEGVTVRIKGHGTVTDNVTNNPSNPNDGIWTCKSPAATPTGVLWTGGPDCDGTYGLFWGIELFASPPTGWSFVRWENAGGSGACHNSANKTCSFASGFGTTTLTAVFADTADPATSIVSGPSGPVASTSASFTFASYDPAGTLTPTASPIFDCRLLAGGVEVSYTLCDSGTQSYPGLTNGTTYTFQVRSGDRSGNWSGWVARSFTVDIAGPSMVSLNGPVAATSDPVATFTFGASSDVAPITFRCRLDGGPQEPCTSGITKTIVADGPHTFEVKAIDGLGNHGPWRAHSWTLDRLAPDTAITQAPSGIVGSTTATLSFSSEAGASFECSRDGEAWKDCSSPHSESSLADGAHTFAVRATDAVGNTDPTPATASWAVDTTSPDTRITAGPPARTASRTALFGFASTESGSTFECSRDGGSFAPCASPTTLSALAFGRHTFAVRAVDAVGNADATPATSSWISAPAWGLFEKASIAASGRKLTAQARFAIPSVGPVTFVWLRNGQRVGTTRKPPAARVTSTVLSPRAGVWQVVVKHKKKVLGRATKRMR